MMTNMLYELGEDVNDETQRKKFDLEYQKYLEKEGRKKRNSKAKLSLDIPSKGEEVGEEEIKEQDEEEAAIGDNVCGEDLGSLNSSTMDDIQAHKFNNSFCHFDAMDKQLDDWDSENEVPEEITHQESVEDLKPSHFQEELERIQQANKTAEGFHRRKHKQLTTA